ncbi:MAG: T9SS type A sorting domain-containing protein [bacterium]
MHWSVFMISGHTAIPAVFAVTAPDSGYSLDNLAPAAPVNLAGEEVETGIQLTWDESVDEDFNYFTLYRSLTPGFDPKTVEPIAKLTETSYIDSDVIIGFTYHYRLSALDFSGNESAFSPQLSLLVTSVEGAGSKAIPEDYVLEQNYPNPFNPSTTINFGLKEFGHVRLTVYNALGEEVMKVIDRDLEAGYHRVVFSAHNFTSGLYFYKILVNDFTAVKKMIVTK